MYFHKNYICSVNFQLKYLYFMKKLLLFILILSFVGCGQHAKRNMAHDIPQPTVYTTPAGDKIVFLEDYYRVYLKDIKIDYKNRNIIYEQAIKDTIFNKYFSKCEYAGLISDKLSTPIRDTTELGNYVYEIGYNRAKIEELVTSALAESRKYLKDDSITIYIIPADYDIEKTINGMGGVLSSKAGSKEMLITIDPEMTSWKEMLSYNIAREYNQAYWAKMNFKKEDQTNLLDYLLSEGRADSYAHLIYPKTIAPWTNVFNLDVELDMWNKIKSQLNNRDMAFQYNVMYGSKNEYVLWGGFTLGYHIVQSVLKNHPELTPAEWTNCPSDKMLQMSDYR